MLGHEVVGAGPRRVIILHDWIADTSTWDGVRPYLDPDRLTLAFADLRGYGRSRGQPGRFDVTEAAADVVALADALGWDRCAIVGHSMSTLVALHLAQHAPDRIARTVLVTPPPPAGFGSDDATVAQMQAVGHGDDTHRERALRYLWGDRLGDGWIRHKVARWRATADAAAVAGYVAMFARDGVPDPARPIAGPVLAITGAHDGEPMRRAAVEPWLTALAPGARVIELADCGHYPMPEAPPLTATLLARFLLANESGTTAPPG